MAINTGNGKKPETAIQAAMEKATQNQQSGSKGGYQNSGAGQGRRRNMMDINTSMRRPVSRKSSGEVVLQYCDKLEALMGRNFKEGFENSFKLLVLDNNASNVGPLSSILVCYHERGPEKDHLAVYTLLVEASASRLQNRFINVGGRNVEVETVAGDVFNEFHWGRVEDFVQTTYGAKLDVIDAGIMVLPSELDPEDDEHLRRVLFNSTQACYTVMEDTVGTTEEPFSIAWINTGSENLTARLDYNPGQAESATGDPIRSDVRIVLQGSLAGNNASNEAGFDMVRDLASVDGFVDLVYTPPKPAPYGQMPQTQHYHPRLILTSVDSEVDAITMELQLLALAQVTLLTHNHAWAGVFRPRHNVKGVDTRDIGAIGYEVSMAGDGTKERVDTKSQAFDINALYQFLSMNISDKLIISMDVEETGALSWIHQAFAAAAGGNPGANSYILDAANNLTNGHFTSFFQGGPIAIDDQNRIHLGYYIDNEGTRRDLREIDYLALLNHAGKDDPSLVAKWSDTFDNVSIPMEIRLEDRTKILKALLTSQNVHVKGYARRYTLSPDFIRALTQACGKAGLVIRPNNLIQDFNNGTVRGNQAAASFGIGGGDVNNLFNSGQSAWGGYQSTGFHGRFGRHS